MISMDFCRNVISSSRHLTKVFFLLILGVAIFCLLIVTNSHNRIPFSTTFFNSVQKPQAPQPSSLGWDETPSKGTQNAAPKETEPDAKHSSKWSKFVAFPSPKGEQPGVKNSLKSGQAGSMQSSPKEAKSGVKPIPKRYKLVTKTSPKVSEPSMKTPIKIMEPGTKSSPKIAKPGTKTSPKIAKPGTKTSPKIAKPGTKTSPKIAKPGTKTSPKIAKPGTKTSPKIAKPGTKTYPKIAKPGTKTSPKIANDLEAQDDGLNAYNSSQDADVLDTWEKMQYTPWRLKVRVRIIKSNLTIRDVKVPPFLKNFKNPCWYEDSPDRHLYCLPYFYLAGFPKCGTTDLYFRMMAHPLIVPCKQKEPHYLTRAFFYDQHVNCPSNVTHCGTMDYSKEFYAVSSKLIQASGRTNQGLARVTSSKDYRNLNWIHADFAKKFPNETMDIVRAAQAKHEYPAIAIDASASTAWDYHLWRNITENAGAEAPEYTTVDWVNRINPDARTIMIMRNPVERTFSDYVFWYQNSATLENFHQRVEMATRTINFCLSNGIASLACTTSRVGLRLGINLYHLHVGRWLERFPRENFLMLRFEDYKRNSSKVLESVYEFLDLPPVSQKAMDFIVRSKAKNVSSVKKKLGDMWPETRDILDKFFKPHNQKLAKLLKDDKFLWED